MSLHSRAKRSDSFTNWFFAYTKLRFFTRMRRLLLLNGLIRQSKPPEIFMDTQKAGKNEEETAAGKSEGRGGWMAAVQRSVKKLHFGSWEEKEAAAAEIKKLAEEDLKRRKTMAELGVIPPLVAMAGSDVVARRKVAVRALVELANGSFTNKALMVEAGLLSNLPENTGVSDETDRQELAELLLSISALANTQFPLISAVPMIPAVVSILHSNPNTTLTKQSCITALYNLSTILNNAGALITAGAVTALLTLSSVKSLSGECLATLGNLVVNLAGRRELERSPMMPESLIEILTWEDEPKCQESAAYILMVLAHQSPLQRRKMAAAGVVEVLLGLALLGSPLAQKRALKMVEMFRDERQRGIGPHSGPQMGRAAAAAGSRWSGDEGRILMKKIVKQSLDKNMEIITRRANGGVAGGDCSEMKGLVVSSSSKSLPY